MMIIRHQKALTYVLCIAMGIFSAGCYTVDAVRLSEAQTIDGKKLFTETMIDGRSVKYHGGDLDSLQISGATVARFSNGRMLSSTPIDSVRSIETKTFSPQRTAGAIVMTAATAMVVAFIFLATLQSQKKKD